MSVVKVCKALDAFIVVKQYLCRHDWRPTKFQALVGGRSYRCSKCGKQAKSTETWS